MQQNLCFKHVVEKINILKKSLNGKVKLRLLNKVSDNTVKEVEKSIQTVCSSGKEEERLTETRVRLYRQMKAKFSQPLPPDQI